MEPNKLAPSAVSFSELHPHAPGRCYCFVAKASEQHQLLFLTFSSDAKAVLEIDKEILAGITDAIESRVELIRSEVKTDFIQVCQRASQEVKSSIESVSSLNDKLRIAKFELQELLPADFVCLAAIHGNGVCRRITLGQSDSVLNEMDISAGPENSYFNRVSEEKRIMTFNDISENSETDFPRLLQLSGIKSIIALPLTGAGQTKGVLTIGSTKIKAYSKAQVGLLNACFPAFESILNELTLVEQSATLSEREKYLYQFATDLREAKSAQEVYARTAGTINQIINCSMVRLSTTDTEHKFLSSHTLLNNSKSKARTPESAHLILSLLRWHNVAVENGHTVIVDCQPGPNGMDNVETMQMFTAGIKRAVIVPVKSNGRVYALISLADDKALGTSPLNEDNIQFVELLAVLVGLALEAHNSHKDALSEFAVAARNEIVDASQSRGIRSRVRSSLTSILGSVEMIKNSDNQDSVQKERFLNIIDKSARKLSEFLTE
jgi:GAF domain-containing protein